MADLSEKIPEAEITMDNKDPDGALSSSEDSQVKKTCADCGTSKTPLWRGGPDGPKSLCNACGIRSRKRRRAMLGLTNSDDKKEAKKITSNNNNDNTYDSNNNSLNDELLAIGREVMKKRRSKMDKQMRKLGEEEQAAVLLMAISYSSVYA